MQGNSAFVDTNIFVYAFDQRDPAKRKVAIALIVKLLRERNGVISYQVIQEFLNVAIRESVPGLTASEGRRYLSEVAAQFQIQAPTIAHFDRAIALHSKSLLPWYDCLVLVSALSAGCAVIYSEDWQHGQTIEGLLVVNPFL